MQASSSSRSNTGGAGSGASPATTSCSCQLSGKPLSLDCPRSTKRDRAGDPVSRRTRSETKISPPSALSVIRAAALTASPVGSSSTSMVSPKWIPMRRRGRRSESACWTATANSTADLGVWNVSIKPSPDALTVRPPYGSTRSRTTARVRSIASTPFSLPARVSSSVDDSTSTNATVCKRPAMPCTVRRHNLPEKGRGAESVSSLMHVRDRLRTVRTWSSQSSDEVRNAFAMAKSVAAARSVDRDRWLVSVS